MDLQKIAADAGISIDEVRERWLSLRVAIWKSDFRRFAKEALRIRAKSGDLEPLELNEAQEILHHAAEDQLADEQWVRLAGLKGRRQGFSTYVAARGYWRATLWDRQKGLYSFARNGVFERAFRHDGAHAGKAPVSAASRHGQR
jgi:hypothetical protein